MIFTPTEANSENEILSVDRKILKPVSLLELSVQPRSTVEPDVAVAVNPDGLLGTAGAVVVVVVVEEEVVVPSGTWVVEVVSDSSITFP